MNEIEIKNISALSVYKLVAISTVFFWAPIFLLCGVLSIFGMNTVLSTEGPVHGLLGLAYAIWLFVVWVVLASGIFGTIFYVGLRLFFCFRAIKVRVLAIDPRSQAGS